MSRKGARLVLSARSEDKLAEVADECTGHARVLPMDIADDESVASAAEQVGDIDGFVFVAGVYWPMKATEWNREQAVNMLDVNLTGAVRVLGHVVPRMIDQGHGHIVLTGSLSGFRGLPGAVGYGASKAGLMNLAETMHIDLQGTGVDVQLINPGYVKTRLTEKNDFKMPFAMEPEEAAREFVDHMYDDSFAKSFPRAFASLFKAGRSFPTWAWRRMWS
jgi:NADP-dependent 3-hydroxy acid dehydrogenase YdfG